MKIAIGTDHGGKPLAQPLIEAIRAAGHEPIVVGTELEGPADDYPLIAKAVADTLDAGRAQRGVLLCGSGAGVTVAANKLPGVRAALAHDTYTAHQMVEHDLCNVLTLGARVIGPELAVEIVTAFVNASFSGEERHRRRVGQILDLERQRRMNPLTRLYQAGQSIWLDNIRRAMLDSGTLARYIADLSLTGLTSNPTIFERAMAGSTDYDDAILKRLNDGLSTEQLFFEIALEDITAAADLFRPVFDVSGGVDGFVSLEVSPTLANDTEGTISEAKRLHAEAGRPNLLIKVPGTVEGLGAIEELIFAGIPVNVTLLFSREHYLAAADAYMKGIERRIKAGLDPNVPSVASLFISRWDAGTASKLPDNLRNRLGIAIAQRTFTAYQDVLASKRWQRLAAAGAQPQRLLWASTSAKDPALPDTYYISALAAKETINTMPEATLLAFAHHGQVGQVMSTDGAAAEAVIQGVTRAGIDVNAFADGLQIKGRDSFRASFDHLLQSIEAKVAVLREARGMEKERLSDLASPADAAVADLAQQQAPARIWSIDHTLWQKGPTEVANRLGWLVSPHEMEEQVDDLQSFTTEAVADGFTHVLWCGMGGSSLFPQVLRQAFQVGKGGLDLRVLDTSDPGTVHRLAEELPLGNTLFVAASKSGGTIETRSHLAYFWERVRNPKQFAVVTDAGTPLDELAAREGFRPVYPTNPDNGGRYSALSHFGMLPGALLAVDIVELLRRAAYMAAATAPSVRASANPALRLGAVLAEAAKAGRDKCTLFMPPEVANFGMWLEQLIAESTGKSGVGILPVAGEDLGAPEVYSNDRIFVTLGETAGLDALAAAGHPVVQLDYVDRFSIGAEVFRWEFAIAVAGAVLGINPFDQPNVEAAKKAASRVLKEGLPEIPTEAVGSILGQVKAGDYIAIQAYVDTESPSIEGLQRARMALRDKYRVATTLGLGPRYLHSNGQLHKGGPVSGVFLQIVGDDPEDIPIPGSPYGFSMLKQAQAAGDYLALRERGRRVARVSIEKVLDLGR
jgi:transaldolase/glucose-6-phosphate isomerase